MRIILVFFILIPSFLHAGYSQRQDSIGIEEVDGKKFILHKVDTKETLYTVSRRYDVPIYDIIKNNPPTEFGLQEGQVLRIPYKTKPVVTSSKEETKVMTNASNGQSQLNITQIPSKNKGHKPVVTEVTHTVQPKETLFSISRQYNVTVDEIKEWNNLNTNLLDIGQQLIIKKSDDIKEELNSSSVLSDQFEIKKTHVVLQRQTLYAISKEYGATIDDLKLWNNLSSNDISIGQELIVEASEKTIPVPTIIKNPIDSGKTKSSSNSIVIKDTSQIQPSTVTTTSTIDGSNFEEIVETGLAELIDGTDNNRKYLALHRTANVGTILRVRNEMNDQEVFVRVLGRLPDTSVNKNVIIKISKSAYDRLGAIDARFRVKVSYMP